MENSIFDIIMNYSVNEEMNKILLEDEEYIGIQKEIDEQTEEYAPGFDKSAVSGSGQACIRIYGKRCMLWKGGLQERVS